MNTINLGEIPVCSEAAVLPLNAGITGLWAMATHFNGAYKYKQFNAAAGEAIVLPVALNENYTYLLKLYKPDGALFNDTAYTIKTVPLLPDITYTCYSAGENDAIAVTVSSGKKQYVAGENQTVFVSPLFEQSQVMVFIEGALRQEGDADDEYVFDKETGTITLNTVAIAGQKITILYFKNL